MMVLRILMGAGLGELLALMGFPFTTWQFWVVMAFWVGGMVTTAFEFK